MPNPVFSIGRLRDIHLQVVNELGKQGFKALYDTLSNEFHDLEREGLNTMQALSRLILRSHGQDDGFNIPIHYLAAVATEMLDPDSRVLEHDTPCSWAPKKV